MEAHHRHHYRGVNRFLFPPRTFKERRKRVKTSGAHQTCLVTIPKSVSRDKEEPKIHLLDSDFVRCCISELSCQSLRNTNHLTTHHHRHHYPAYLPSSVNSAEHNKHMSAEHNKHMSAVRVSPPSILKSNDCATRSLRKPFLIAVDEDRSKENSILSRIRRQRKLMRMMMWVFSFILYTIV